MMVICPEQPPQLGSHAGAKSQRNAAQQRPAMVVIMLPRKPQQRRLVDGFFGLLAFDTFGLQPKSITSMMAFFFSDDTDQQNDADQSDDAEILMANEQSQQSADTSRRQAWRVNL